MKPAVRHWPRTATLPLADYSAPHWPSGDRPLGPPAPGNTIGPRRLPETELGAVHTFIIAGPVEGIRCNDFNHSTHI